MNHKNQLIKNTVIIAIGKIGSQILSYILLPLFTAKMAVDEYGTYDLACTMSVFLAPVITMLMEEAMFRFLIDAKTEKEKKDIISQTVIYTIIGFIVFVPLALIFFKFYSKYPASFTNVFIIFIISDVLILVSSALARGLSEIKLYSITNFLLGISTLAITIYMLLVYPKAEGLLWANTIANLITAAIVFYKLKIHLYIGKPNKKIMRQMAKYSIPLVPNSISWSIINMSDRVIITQLMDTAANGIYAMASKFPSIINVLYSYFYTAWKESAAKIIKDENRNEAYNSIYHDMQKFLYAVTLCLIACMPFVFPIFINRSYADAYQYIPLIMIATYYSCISSFYGGIFGAFKKTKIMGTTTIVAAILNLIVDLVLINYIGIYAACISTLLSNMLISFYRKDKLKKYLKLKELNKVNSIAILGLVCLAYYSKFIPIVSNGMYLFFSLFALLIAVVYSYKLNREFIFSFVDKIKNRRTRKTNN